MALTPEELLRELYGDSYTTTTPTTIPTQTYTPFTPESLLADMGYGDILDDSLEAHFRAGSLSAAANTIIGVPTAFMEAGQQTTKAIRGLFGDEKADEYVLPGLPEMRDALAKANAYAEAGVATPDTLTEKVFRAAPQTIAQVAPYLISPAAGLTSSFATIAAGETNEAVAKGLKPAFESIIPSAALQAAVETAFGPEAALMKAGFKKTVSGGAKKLAVTVFDSEALLMKIGLGRLSKTGLGRVTADSVLAGVFEPVEEVVQTGVGGLSRAYMGEFKGKSFGEAASAVGNEAIEAAQVAAVLGPLFGGSVSAAQEVINRPKSLTDTAPTTPWTPPPVRDDLPYDRNRMFADVAQLVGPDKAATGIMPLIEARAQALGEDPDEHIAKRIEKIVSSGVPPEGALFQMAAEVAPGPMWYSRMANLVEAKAQKKSTVGDVVAMLEANQVNPEELSFSGLLQLDPAMEISKEGLLQYLDENAVTVEEKVQGERSNEVSQRMREISDEKKILVKYFSSTESTDIGFEEATRRYLALTDEEDALVSSSIGFKYDDKSLSLPGYIPGTRREIILKAAKPGLEQLPDQHFPGSVAWARVNERKTADGKHAIHLDESQSDAHQKPQALAAKENKRRLKEYEEAVKRGDLTATPPELVGKEWGYGSVKARDEEIRAAKEAATEAWFVYSNAVLESAKTIPEIAKHVPVEEDLFRRGILNRQFVTRFGDILESFDPSVAALRERARVADEASYRAGLSSAFPNLPFKRNWEEVVAKRTLRYAAERGADVLTWTTGEQQVDRYEDALRRNVKSIAWNRFDLDSGTEHVVSVLPSAEEPDWINLHVDRNGRVTKSDIDGAIGKDINDILGSGIADRVMSEPKGELSGDGLTIGGQGMIAAYDVRIPSIYKKIGKKYGVSPYKTFDAAGNEIWAIDITPEMRRDQLLYGNALWQVQKAAVVFGPDGRAVIHAMQGADVSSVVHELMHIWEHDLAGDDLAAVRKYVGAKGSDPLDVGQKEKLARAFERYVYEGVPPVKELENAFWGLRSWMGQIYAKFTDSEIDVPLSKSLRGVFNGMFTAREMMDDGGVDILSDLTRLRDKIAAKAKEDVDAQVFGPEMLEKKGMTKRGIEHVTGLLKHLTGTDKTNLQWYLRTLPRRESNEMIQLLRELKDVTESARAQIVYESNVYASDAKAVVDDYINRVRERGGTPPTQNEVFELMGEVYQQISEPQRNDAKLRKLMVRHKAKEAGVNLKDKKAYAEFAKQFPAPPPSYDAIGDEQLAAFLRDRTAPMMNRWSSMVERMVLNPELKQAIRDNHSKYLFRSYAFFTDPQNFFKAIDTSTEAYKKLFKEVKTKKLVAKLTAQFEATEWPRLEGKISKDKFDVQLERFIQNRIQGEISDMIYQHLSPPRPASGTNRIIDAPTADYAKKRVLTNKTVREILGQEKRLDYLVHHFASELGSDIAISTYRSGFVELLMKKGYIREGSQGPISGEQVPGQPVRHSVDVKLSKDKLLPYNEAVDGPDYYLAHPSVAAIFKGMERNASAMATAMGGFIGLIKSSKVLNWVNIMAQGISVPAGLWISSGLLRGTTSVLSTDGLRAAQLAKEMTNPGSAGAKSALLKDFGLHDPAAVRSAVSDLIGLGLDEAGEFAHDFKMVADALLIAEQNTGASKVAKSALGAAKGFSSWMHELFRRPDVIVKVIAYQNILNELADKYEIAPEQANTEIRREAAQMAMALTQAPSTNPNWIKFLSGRGAKSPVTALIQTQVFGFQSFAYQVLKMHKNAALFGFRDVFGKAFNPKSGLNKSQRLKHLMYGTDRLAGAATALVMFWEAFSRFAFDDEDKEKVDAVKGLGFADQQHGRVFPGIPAWVSMTGSENKPLVERKDGRIYFNITDSGSADLTEPAHRILDVIRQSYEDGKRLIESGEIDSKGMPKFLLDAAMEVGDELQDLFLSPSMLMEAQYAAAGYRTNRAGGKDVSVLQQFFPKSRQFSNKDYVKNETPIGFGLPDQVTYEGVGLAARKIAPTEIIRWLDISIGLAHEAGITDLERAAPASQSLKNHFEYQVSRMSHALSPMTLDAAAMINTQLNSEWTKEAGWVEKLAGQWGDVELSDAERLRLVSEYTPRWNQLVSDLRGVYGKAQRAGLSDFELLWVVEDKEARKSVVPSYIHETILNYNEFPSLGDYLDSTIR